MDVAYDLHRQNIETFNLQHVLDRTYPLTSLAWTSDQATDYQLAQFKFPLVLFSIPQIAALITQYRYFRGKIRVNFRVTSNPYNYGALVACFSPNGESDFRTSQLNQRDVATGYPHVLLSAANSDSVSLDIPFIYPNRFLDLEFYNPDAMAFVSLSVALPLRNVNGENTPANVDVTASFIDAELSLPRSLPQSGRFSVEAIRKASKNSVSSTLDGVSSAVAVINTVMPSAPLNVLKNAISGASVVSKLVGLNKPLNLDRTQMVFVNPYSDLNTTGGVNSALTLANTIENSVSSHPGVSSCNADEMDLKVLASIPSCTHYGHITDLATRTIGNLTNEFHPSISDIVAKQFTYTTGGTKYKLYFFAPKVLRMRAVIFLSSTAYVYPYSTTYHKYVDIEGDTEVEFTIPYIDSEFVSSDRDMRIMMKPLHISNAFAVPDEGPYLMVYKSAASDVRYFVPSDHTATLAQCNPRFDFTKDFQMFHEPMQGYSCDNLVIGENITNVRELIHKELPITWTGSEYNYARTFVPQGSFRKLVVGNFVDQTNVLAGAEIWSKFYRFWRGSTNFRYVSRTNPSAGALCFATPCSLWHGSQMEEGFTYLSQSTAISTSDTSTSTLKVSVPYYTQRAFLSTDPPSDAFRADFGPITGLGAAADATRWYVGKRLVYKSCGDDFTFAFVVKPPKLTYSESSSSTSFDTPCSLPFKFYTETGPDLT